MAKVYITRYSIDARNWARLSNGQAVSVLGGQLGDTIELEAGEASVETAAVSAAQGALYRIRGSGGDCRMRIGKDALADAASEPLFDGDDELRYLMPGQRISVLAFS